MTKEQAYERLELPINTDLQTVRQQFAAMHNDYRMQIDNAFNSNSKRIFEQKLEELKEAYATLNESDGIDDSADLPRINYTEDHPVLTEQNEQNSEIDNLEQALTIFGLAADQDDISIAQGITSYISELQKQLSLSTLPTVQQAYQQEIARAESARVILLNWLNTRGKKQEFYSQQTEVQQNNREVSAKRKQPIWIYTLLAVFFLFGSYYVMKMRPESSAPIIPTLIETDITLIQDSAAWKIANAANNEGAYQSYLKEFPSGSFSGEAKSRIEKFNDQQKTTQSESKKLETQHKKEIEKAEQKIVVAPVVKEESTVDKIANLATMIRFNYDSSIMEPMSVLEEISKLMLEEPNKGFKIKVFSDEGNSSDYERKISERKANSIKQYFISKGVSNSSLSTVGFGNSKSVCKEDNSTCYNKNNRLEIEVNGI